MIEDCGAFWKYPSGREVCKDEKPAGRNEYRGRTLAMVQRQGWICALCGATMGFDASFDHEHGRGMGGAKRDDRIEIEGQWQNAAVHIRCNTEKGSRYVPYVITQK